MLYGPNTTKSEKAALTNVVLYIIISPRPVPSAAAWVRRCIEKLKYTSASMYSGDTITQSSLVGFLFMRDLVWKALRLIQIVQQLV